MITEFRGPYRFLSNFYPAPITTSLLSNQVTIASAEHLYQALKTQDPSEQLYVAMAPTAGEAKRRGRRIVIRPDWDRIKVDAMHRIIAAKFDQNDELRHRLVATGNQELVEGNSWHDNFWGDCHCGRSQCATRGHNQLGHILMRYREAITTDLTHPTVAAGTTPADWGFTADEEEQWREEQQ